MIKFILAACLYLATLLAILPLFPDNQPQLLHEFALDQAEFNQSLPEIKSLKNMEFSSPSSFFPKITSPLSR